MAESLIPDPLQMWRKAVASLEGRGNSLANSTMNTGEFASALHQVANMSLGMQQTFEKVLGVYLKNLNLPSRKEVAELAASLQRVEAKLDQLLTAEAREPSGRRPARTRRRCWARTFPSIRPLPSVRTRWWGRGRGSARAPSSIRTWSSGAGARSGRTPSCIPT